MVSVAPVSPVHVQRLKLAELLPRCLICPRNVRSSAFFIGTFNSGTPFTIFETPTERRLGNRVERSGTTDATIPVTLLNPIFRQFVDNCQNHRPNEEDNKLVLELMQRGLTQSSYLSKWQS